MPLTSRTRQSIVGSHATATVDPSFLAAIAAAGILNCAVYTARQLARINQTDRAISALSNTIDMGYLCATAISRDPWFASLRPSPRYTELMRKAELRRSESHAAFLAAGGDQVISVT